MLKAESILLQWACIRGELSESGIADTLTPAVLAAITILALGTSKKSSTRHLELKPEHYNGTVSVEHLSVAGNLDGFKMSTQAARESADLCYFDVFSKTSNQTLNIVFFQLG
ncbi:hypothetical protein ACJZ2D_007815 [Fusarium nematophilum]